MGSRFVAADSTSRALTSDEYAALSQWAEEVPSLEFADEVVDRWLAEGRAEPEEETPVESSGLQRTGARFGGRQAIGWISAIAAAAAVMLMVRVMPPRVKGSSVSESTPSAVSSPDHETLAGLEAEMMVAFSSHCGPCHDGADSESTAEALEVFDLQRPGWWTAVSEVQLHRARARVGSLDHGPECEHHQMETLIDSELARRAHSG